MGDKVFLWTFVDLDAALLREKTLELAENLAKSLLDLLVSFVCALQCLLDVTIAALFNDFQSLFSVLESLFRILDCFQHCHGALF